MNSRILSRISNFSSLEQKEEKGEKAKSSACKGHRLG